MRYAVYGKTEDGEEVYLAFTIEAGGWYEWRKSQKNWPYGPYAFSRKEFAEKTVAERLHGPWYLRPTRDSIKIVVAPPTQDEIDEAYAMNEGFNMGLIAGWKRCEELRAVDFGG